MGITNEDLLPDWAWREVIQRKPDLASIKAAVLVDGQTVPGAVNRNGAPVTLRSA